MPHLRERHAERIILKRFKLWPVLGVLGPRQVGKSTLLRERIAKRVGAKYLTLDVPDVRRRAVEAPSQLLRRSGDEGPLIIDEVQKAPDLFDSIKAEVDELRKPGRFLISGSTEFSKKTGIRESLTGRVGLLRLYPLTLAETHGKTLGSFWLESSRGRSTRKFSIPDFDRAVRRGGMPGICFLREDDERAASFEAWLDTTCYRDLSAVRDTRLDANLARDLLAAMSDAESTSSASLARALRIESRRVGRHLEGLEALFVLLRLPPHSSGTGKHEFLPFDAGLAHYLQLSERERWRILLANEILAEHEYAGKPRPKLSYYQSSRGSRADLVIEYRPGRGSALFLLDSEKVDAYALRGPEAFLRRNPDFDCRVLYLGAESYAERPNIHVSPLLGSF